ncbi:MAG: PIN domain-containing protein [Candidatus Woesearchaeota archaeon]
MRELFDNLPRISLQDNCDFLIDSCFFVWIFEKNKEKEFERVLEKSICAITSFNADELAHISHRLNDKVRESARKELKKSEHLFLLDVPVKPGNKMEEIEFVKRIVPEFNCVEHDPSDAVILAAAVSTGANVLTRDKHDLFNARMANCLNRYSIKVLNTFERV